MRARPGSDPSPARRTGRPRDAAIDRAVLDATLGVLDDIGYSRLTIDEVARRAGTTKPAIYRRWPTRQHLVLHALAHRLGAVEVPDTECTMCDLVEAINVYVSAFTCVPPDVLGPLLADCAREPELRAEFMATLFDPPRAAVGPILDRGLARGDLRPDLDRELTLDLLGSLVHYRALFGHAATGGEQIEAAVETLLRGIATDYPALVERSLRLAEEHRARHPHT